MDHQKAEAGLLDASANKTRIIKIVGRTILIFFAVMLWQISLPILAIWYFLYKTGIGKKIFIEIKKRTSHLLQYKWSKKAKIITSLIFAMVVILIVAVAISGAGTPTFKDLPEKTTQQLITIKGFWTQDNAKVKVFLNNNLVSETQADDKGRFELVVTLSEGDNFLYAVASYKDGEKKSVEKKIIYIDQAKIDAQNKAEADAKMLAEKNRQAEIEAQNKTNADAKEAAKIKEEEDKRVQEEKDRIDSEKQKEAEKMEQEEVENQSEGIEYKQERLHALSLVQTYEIKKTISAGNWKYEIEAGTKLGDVFKLQKQSGFVSSNGRWVVVKDENRFVVIYRSMKLDIYQNNPQWSIVAEDVKALNGTAINYTPELGYQNPSLDVNNFTKARKIYLRWMKIAEDSTYDEALNGNNYDIRIKTENEIMAIVAKEFGISVEDARIMFFEGMQEENNEVKKINAARGDILSAEKLVGLLKEQGDLYIQEN